MNNVTLSTPTTTKPAIKIIDRQAVTTSHDIARCFRKQHKDVLRKIESLDCSHDFHERNFAPMIIDTNIGKGAVRQDKAYNITRDGFVFLAMGFTGQRAAQFKEAYIEAFNEMEVRLQKQAEQFNPQVRMVMVVENGEVVATSVMGKMDFVTSADKLAKLIKVEPYFNTSQLIDIIQAASGKLACNKVLGIN